MKLVLKQDGTEDWYLIERAEHENREWLERIDDDTSVWRYSGRISDADVEGTAFEMLAIADAIKARGWAKFKRCAVSVSRDCGWCQRTLAVTALGRSVTCGACGAEYDEDHALARKGKLLGEGEIVVLFESPRNSRLPGVVPLSDADRLADEIISRLRPGAEAREPSKS